MNGPRFQFRWLVAAGEPQRLQCRYGHAYTKRDEESASVGHGIRWSPWRDVPTVTEGEPNGQTS